MLMQVNKHAYEMLSPRNNYLPFWHMWTNEFRPHTYNEFRVMFALTRCVPLKTCICFTFNVRLL
jgi:hypothetical protein